MFHNAQPGLTLPQAPGGPPGDGGDGDHSGGDQEETPLGTDEDRQPPRRSKRHGDPDSTGDGGGKDPHGRKTVSLSITNGRNPLPNSISPPEFTEGEQDQADVGIMVYECCVGNVYLE